MAAEEPSTSASEIQQQEEGSEHDLYITHRVSKLDTLAGLAVKYHVEVADIKRANGLLSDSAMFAKDTLLIPTRSLPVGLEYSTWAGMIVTQYGRIPGDYSRASLAFGSTSPPRQSAALDQLQRYYGTGDTASEPSDFRPAGDPDCTEGSLSGTEIELSEMDHLGRLTQRSGSGDRPECSGSVEYAGSRSGAQHAGTLADERLRRRKAGEASASTSPARRSEAGEAAAGGSPERAAGAASDPLLPGTSGRNGQHRRALTQSQHLGKRETILERLKRVASQPALAVPQAPSLARISDAVLAPLADSLPPLPPGTNKGRDRASALVTPRQRDKEFRKAD